ncbi:hypothetical protein GDO86_018823 [Hymenochirus boettgeri]|uniref:Tumor necrosis factor receptor superfamily member 12A n=1 Tax=Hymenochirus boettgeri TaxID=247094 RepID=A0A8T2IJ93_9PIPI|nr:hypothetical protein GDO86_018823 [Hymenochirus boettgeri]
MTLLDLLHTTVLVLLVPMCSGEAPRECLPQWSWSADLGKCMDCSICETSSKSDFCQTCDVIDKQADFPWLWVGVAAGLSVALIAIILGVTVYLTHCRRKNKFTTPIEETGSHSAEALLIH